MIGKKREVLKQTAAAKKILKEIAELKTYTEKAGKALNVVRLSNKQFKELGVSHEFIYKGVTLKLDKGESKCMNQSSLI